MPREMNPENDATHRVVIIQPRYWRKPGEAPAEEYTWTRCYGPYSKLGTAKGILKKELDSLLLWATDAEREKIGGWIEKSATEWRRVE